MEDEDKKDGAPHITPLGNNENRGNQVPVEPTWLEDDDKPAVRPGNEFFFRQPKAPTLTGQNPYGEGDTGKEIPLKLDTKTKPKRERKGF